MYQQIKWLLSTNLITNQFLLSGCKICSKYFFSHFYVSEIKGSNVNFGDLGFFFHMPFYIFIHGYIGPS